MIYFFTFHGHRLWPFKSTIWCFMKNGVSFTGKEPGKITEIFDMDLLGILPAPLGWCVTLTKIISMDHMEGWIGKTKIGICMIFTEVGGLKIRHTRFLRFNRFRSAPMERKDGWSRHLSLNGTQNFDGSGFLLKRKI